MSGKPWFVFSVTRIGDLVHATLTLDALAEEGRITVVTSPGAAALVRPDPRVESVEVVRGTHPLAWRARVLGLLVSARFAGARVVNLELWESRWRFVRRGSRLLGLERRELDLPRLTRDRASAIDAGDPGSLPHLSTYYARAVGISGAEAPLPVLYDDPDAARRVEERLAALGPAGAPLVVVHPGSSEGWTAKRAPAQVYARLLDGIGSTGPLRVLLVGTAEERALAAEIGEILGPRMPVRSWVGELALAELPPLLRRTDLFVGNDSGPLRVAEAVGTPTLSLWGATSPEHLAPRGGRHGIARFRVDCHPCFLIECPRPVHCMARIDVDRAAARAVELLGGE